MTERGEGGRKGGRERGGMGGRERGGREGGERERELFLKLYNSIIACCYSILFIQFSIPLFPCFVC